MGVWGFLIWAYRRVNVPTPFLQKTVFSPLSFLASFVTQPLTRDYAGLFFCFIDLCFLFLFLKDFIDLFEKGGGETPKGERGRGRSRLPTE